MIGTLYLGKQLGPDHATFVGWLHGIVPTEPRSGWSTNSKIAQKVKGKKEIPCHIFNFGVSSHFYTREIAAAALEVAVEELPEIHNVFQVCVV